MKYFYQYKNLLLVTLFLILFRNLFFPNYQKYIIDTILIHFSRSIISDIIVFAVILFLFFWTYSKLKIRFYLKRDYIVYSLFFLIICAYIRIDYENKLLDMYFFSGIKYFDVSFILLVIPLILIAAFWMQNKKRESEKSDFFDDSPINTTVDDILNRTQKAMQVSRLIKGHKSKSSLAVGIVGEWGNGKTSFMNFVEKSFTDDDSYVIIHFNSWLNISISSIINDFFNTVEKKIGTYSIDVSKEIKKYGNNVLSVNKNSTTETLLNALNIIPDRSLSEDFENLNDLLNKLDKKVIVFFDDLDRLQPNEVFEVLKLIRNTASFDVFNYVVGYDKAYLNEALEKNNIPFSNKYYEKIFLKEFPLPPITQEQVNNYIKDQVLLIVPEKKDELEEIFNFLNAFIIYNSENIFKSISNIRNAKRFLNEFKVSIEKVKDEIYLQDFIMIKLLKFSYYDAYRLLFSKDVYIDVNNEEYSGNNSYTHYKLRKKDKNGGYNYGRVFEGSVLKEDVVALKTFSEEDIKTIGSICERIFNTSYRIHKVDRNSIIYGHNYYRYFEDEIAESAVTNADFNAFMELSFQAKKDIVDKAYKENRIIGFLLFIYKVKIHEDIKSKAEYEDFVRILFYIASLKSITPYLNYYGIDFAFLGDCMRNYLDLLIKKLEYKDEKEIKLFFKSVFFQEKENYYFETDFAKHLNDRSPFSNLDIPLNRKEIEEYLIYCFENDAKLIAGIDKNFWHCYELCFIKDWQKENSNSWIPVTKIIEKNKQKLLYEIIPRYYKEFLIYCVVPQDWYGRDIDSFKVGLANDRLIKLFGSYDIFINYLESKNFKKIIGKDYEFLDEFLEFAKKVNEAKQLINFDFTYSPILEKLNAAKVPFTV